jgi:hypothetical protein
MLISLSASKPASLFCYTIVISWFTILVFCRESSTYPPTTVSLFQPPKRFRVLTSAPQSDNKVAAENNEINNAVLVADAGYPVKKYLLTPLFQTHTRGENVYNEALIRTRNPVERSYGVWKRRFPILSNGINLNIAKVQRIIVATAVLHNIAIKNNEEDPPPLNQREEALFNQAIDVPVDLIEKINGGNFVSNEMITYFDHL